MKEIVELLTKNNQTIATMESCTGGAIVNEITNIEGASQVLKFSAVTYSNEFKIKMGVNSDVIAKYSVYSLETAQEMSKKISDFANADYGIGITGQINRVDKFNPTKETNQIYISIYVPKQDKFYNKIVKALEVNRIENKKMIIDNVIEMLLEIIK